MNRLSTAQRALILQHLIERTGINSACRLKLASNKTILKLLVDAGTACADLHHNHIVNLPCKYLQVDEMWSFVYAKQKNRHDLMPDYSGDSWIWTAICAETKLFVTWYVGKRETESAHAFMEDIAYRVKGRVQITSDGYRGYVKAVKNSFQTNIDYKMLVKPNNKDEEKDDEPTIIGNPDDLFHHNSYVERHNLTLRTSISRLIRKTNGHSKKLENHIHHIALYSVYYNFCRIHETLGTTPAIAAGLTDWIMELEDVVEFMDEYWKSRKRV